MSEETEKKTRNIAVPGFLLKTYEIFNNPEYNYCCGWGPNGDTIVISKIDLFSNDILPKYFKHKNFQSFVRQLNMYDFHKTVQDPSNGEFQHKYFKKNQPDLLCMIKRKANNKDFTQSLIKSSPEEIINEANMTIIELEEQKKELEELKKRIDRLEDENHFIKKLFYDSHNRTLEMEERSNSLLSSIYHYILSNSSNFKKFPPLIMNQLHNYVNNPSNKNDLLLLTNYSDANAPNNSNFYTTNNATNSDGTSNTNGSLLLPSTSYLEGDGFFSNTDNAASATNSTANPDFLDGNEFYPYDFSSNTSGTNGIPSLSSPTLSSSYAGKTLAKNYNPQSFEALAANIDPPNLNRMNSFLNNDLVYNNSISSPPGTNSSIPFPNSSSNNSSSSYSNPFQMAAAAAASSNLPNNNNSITSNRVTVLNDSSPESKKDKIPSTSEPSSVSDRVKEITDDDLQTDNGDDTTLGKRKIKSFSELNNASKKNKLNEISESDLTQLSKNQEVTLNRLDSLESILFDLEDY